MRFTVIGWNFKNTPIEVRERLALTRDQQIELANRLKECFKLGGIVILSTCNRTEFFLVNAEQQLNKIIEMKAAEIPLLPRGAEYPVKKLVSRMVGLRWEDLNYLIRVDELSTPMLLLHSQSDKTVPVTLSDQLATERPDIVSYLRLENAPHGAAWNTDKEVVESSIGAFISQNLNN